VGVWDGELPAGGGNAALLAVLSGVVGGQEVLVVEALSVQIDVSMVAAHLEHALPV